MVMRAWLVEYVFSDLKSPSMQRSSSVSLAFGNCSEDGEGRRRLGDVCGIDGRRGILLGRVCSSFTCRFESLKYLELTQSHDQQCGRRRVQVQ